MLIWKLEALRTKKCPSELLKTINETQARSIPFARCGWWQNSETRFKFWKINYLLRKLMSWWWCNMSTHSLAGMRSWRSQCLPRSLPHTGSCLYAQAQNQQWSAHACLKKKVSFVVLCDAACLIVFNETVKSKFIDKIFICVKVYNVTFLKITAIGTK